MKDIHNITKEYVKDAYKNKKWFPENYCNLASSELKHILVTHWIKVQEVFSYLKKWDGHTFLMTDDGIIIDPTYAQYDKRYRYWLIGTEFPNKNLRENIMSGEEYMAIQVQRYSNEQKS